MIIKTESKDLGGMQVHCTQFAAMQAYPMLARTMKLMSVAAGKVWPMIQDFMKSDNAKDAMAKDIDLELLGPALYELGKYMSEDPTLPLDLLSGCTIVVSGTKHEITSEETFNAVFSGENFKNLYAVMFFVLKVNFADFLGGLGKEHAEDPDKK